MHWKTSIGNDHRLVIYFLPDRQIDDPVFISPSISWLSFIVNFVMKLF